MIMFGNGQALCIVMTIGVQGVVHIKSFAGQLLQYCGLLLAHLSVAATPVVTGAISAGFV
jgi:hypothetical protein